MGDDILIAKNSGLCFGVKRAMRLAKNKARVKGKTVFTLGPIIHNPQAVEILKTKNIMPLDNLEGLSTDNSIIIRSHGVPKEVSENLIKKGYDVVDATCPFVKKAQDIVEELAKKNKKTLILGDKNHPEVIGIKSYANDDVIIINSVDELKKIELPSNLNLNIVCQTTLSVSKLDEIVDYLKKMQVGVEVYNTICYSTNERQKEAYLIAQKVDIVFVVGGKNSSNTCRLFEICKSVNANTIHVEKDTEIIQNNLMNKKIGVVTGASTPSWIIRKVITKIRRLLTDVR